MKLNNLFKSIFVFTIIGVLFVGCGNQNDQTKQDVITSPDTNNGDTIADTTTPINSIQVEIDAQEITPSQQENEIISSVNDTQIEDDIELGELI